MVLLVFTIFDDTNSLDYPPRRVAYHPSVFIPVTDARVILVVRECIWNALVVLLVLQTFDDIGSLGFPPHSVVYLPSVSNLATASHFLRVCKLKPITLSSLLLSIFLGLPSSPDPPEIWYL